MIANYSTSSVTMGTHDDRIRIILPNGIGTIEITAGLRSGSGDPQIRVDVESGAARDGRFYQVRNGEPVPGVVFLTGRRLGDQDVKASASMAALSAQLGHLVDPNRLK
jgi:hypothetical protein